MARIMFAPGAVTSGDDITIPTYAPRVAAVLAAQILRMPSAFTIPDHAQADIVGALADHPAVAHAAGASPVAHTTAELPALTDHDDNPTYHSNHAQADIVAAIADHNAVSHGPGSSAVAHGSGVGSDPSVAAVPTMVDEETITLDVDTLLGDILTLDYIEVGERVPVS